MSQGLTVWLGERDCDLTILSYQDLRLLLGIVAACPSHNPERAGGAPSVKGEPAAGHRASDHSRHGLR